MEIQTIEKQKIDLTVKTIKMLSADAVEKAHSGHPGMPMGFADIAFVLWMQFLRFYPKDPQWHNRDRFVLSAGHGSMLLYSLLHLFGYDLPLDELKRFRQLNSKTPGHPEYGHTPGVEVTTGPLGQGFANGVGMAIAERLLAARFNKYGKTIIDHNIYGVVSDGDLMEGISSEAASLAGHLGLSNIIYVYDNNHITIEGKSSLAFSEDVGKRFEAYSWRVFHVNGYDRDEIVQAIKDAQEEAERPSLIIATTHIGKGSPNKQDSASAHGEPLGEKELELTKENIGWPKEPAFYIPDEVKQLCQSRVEELKREYEQWQSDFNAYQKENLEFSREWNVHMRQDIPDNLESELLKTIKKDSVATRSASGEMMQVIAQHIPSLIGGSADLCPSTKTFIKHSPSVSKHSFEGSNLHFGIREHAMGAILNGMAVYGGIIPYGSTFLIFSDYMRPSIRLAAMMRLRVIYVFTHDSIFLGEDGPSHQPIEQLPSLRAIPNLMVIRPSDATETAYAWIAALNHKNGPTALIFTRQNIPVIDRTVFPSAEQLKHGAYILKDANGSPDIIIMASGSEVSVALETTLKLQEKGVSVRLVSFPSIELFRANTEEYKKNILQETCSRRVAIEAAATESWHEFVGTDGLIIGIDQFGASAPAKALAEHFGFTAESVLRKIEEKWKL